MGMMSIVILLMKIYDAIWDALLDEYTTASLLDGDISV